MVASGAFNNDQTELVLTLDTGGTVTINVPEALRGGLPEFIDRWCRWEAAFAAADNHRRSWASAGNYLFESIDHGGHDKDVVFKEHGPDRTVVSDEPVISTNESL